MTGIFDFFYTIVKWALVIVVGCSVACLLFWQRKAIWRLFSKLFAKQNSSTSATAATSPSSVSVAATEQTIVAPPPPPAQGSETIPTAPDTTCPSAPMKPVIPEEPEPEREVASASATAKSFVCNEDNWLVVGASVQGNGHLELQLPCQDNHAYEYLGDGWGIAVTSDGAGSAKYSDQGSAIVASRTLLHFKELLADRQWKEHAMLPSDIDWLKLSYSTLLTMRDELRQVAKKNHCDVKDLSATVIVVIHSPKGLLATHVGDGRAGYKDMSGQWHALTTPHKGEEANHTIFIPSNFWNIPFYEMKGVLVPEARVVREPACAFTLMSDGCEGAAWQCNFYDEDSNRYFDPNLPHAPFFDPLIETLQEMHREQAEGKEYEEKWARFVEKGNKAFVKETDDKTLLLGILNKG